MSSTYKFLLLLLFTPLAEIAIAREPVRAPESIVQQHVTYRAQCKQSLSNIDQEINNVRARLLGGGDCWWDFSDGRYIVPKVDPSTGQREVSSLYAGSVWLGGVDAGGSLKLACLLFRGSTDNDFWPGPLEAENQATLGTTTDVICEQWDRHFKVLGTEIREHLKKFKSGSYDASSIPEGLRKWPAKGNPYFTDAAGFNLPNTPQGLAGFFDNDDDGFYDPIKGDYPSIEIKGCALENFPDEMIFWIYNDQGAGGTHTSSNGSPIQMEVQVQAFGYQTDDALNDMTFQRYKLINRAPERIDSTFFAFWCDPDLGCSADDYIGCDSLRSLAYAYNQDGVDGQPGASCDGGVATYGSVIPAVGIDYFRGPLNEFGEEIGMSSFIYMNRAGSGNHAPATTDPTQPFEFYNYLTGHWKDGRPITPSGTGYNPLSLDAPVNYCLPSVPTDASGWSMCTGNLGLGDRRTLQATGPFRLQPNAINELIVGVPWVADIGGNCPDLTRLFRADDLAQGLFDNCFKLLDGPPNPPLDIVELDKEIVITLDDYNLSEIEYDNRKEREFREVPPLLTDEQKQFRFQGYRIYQLANGNVSPSDYGDVTKAREIALVDIKDTVSSIYNWVVTTNPIDGSEYFLPQKRVDKANEGVRHTFSFKEDAFALGNDKQLINHRQYYYSIVAYAHNNWATFEPFPNGFGQKFPYLAGRLDVQIYTAIPRPTIDGVLQSKYGDGIPITRLEGVGNGGNFLELDAATKAKMPETDADGILSYEQGKGPISVTIFNPYEVKSGNFELRFVDDNMSDTILDTRARWELLNKDNNDVVLSERTIDALNEQIIEKYGFSISVTQAEETGDLKSEGNGAIDVEFEYADPSNIWLLGIPDGASQPFDYVLTEDFALDQALDPFQSLSQMGDDYMIPYALANWRHDASTRLITPAWMPAINALGTADPASRKAALARLPNVDIVMTSDKSKWSRCVVVESANYYYTGGTYPKDPELRPEGPDEANPDPTKWRRMFDTRWSPSLDKDGKPDNTNTRGFSYFPGYAVDVETGRRLNVFFGENSCYKSDLNPEYTGRDMLFNPSGLVVRDQQFVDDYYDLILGGQHMVYVTDESYDGCDSIAKFFDPSNYPNVNAAASNKRFGVRKITWCGMLLKFPTANLRSVADGLVPTETRIKMRVKNPYQVSRNAKATGTLNNGYPRYAFTINGQERRDLTGIEVDNALDQIRVVPNPYYGFSKYENNPAGSIVKITNLPAKCNVTIYSIDGKYIRDYKRDEVYAPYQQITDALDWDMKNSRGIPVSSGVYIIHIKSPQGERTIKWFGISRKFDPSNI